MKRLYTTVLAAVFALLASGAAAADFAGVVKTVRGTTSAERGTSQVALAPGTRILRGDRVVTGDDGQVGITMRDDTLLTLGPRTELTIDTYEFDARTHDGSFLASLRRGVLSVVTGLLPKRSPESFTVKTRISTMGVRGTEFIIDASE